MSSLLVLGGGASGIAAAIAAAEGGADVTVLERNPKILKKLGVTGNGRGNVLNAGPAIYYGDTEFARQVLTSVPYGSLASFLEGLGIPLRVDDENRVYPAALMASVVADALALRLNQLKIQIHCHTRVMGLRFEQNAFHAEAVESKKSSTPPVPKGKRQSQPKSEPILLPKTYQARKVIVTVGGAAAPAHGTDGSAYPLLTGFGHSLTSLSPALCALLTEKAPIAGLSGQRVRAALTLRHPSGSLLRSTAGEALFAEDGVSGIAAMQLARFAVPGCRLHMDLRPALHREADSVEGLSHWLLERATRRSDQPICALFTGAFPLTLARTVLTAAGITRTERSMATLASRDFLALASAVMDFSLSITGVRGFDSAQVTAGGISSRDFHPETMESRLRPGLYAAGEVLDVDGDCGGFNLMFAFASGLLAGREAAASRR